MPLTEDRVVTMSTDLLTTLLEKARRAGWEQGAGYVNEKHADRYVRNVVAELTGVVLP